MKKTPNFESGIFTPRILVAFFLSSLGVFLALVGVAAPKPAANRSSQAQAIAPVVRLSSYNGVSPALRDIGPAGPAARAAGEEELRHVKPNMPLPPNYVDSVLQTSIAATMPAPLSTFEGMNQSEGCGGCIPPDPNGAVGPNLYVQMTNSAVSVYDKTGVRLLGPTPINALWNNLPGTCKDTNDGDPIVIYDQLADRWILTQFGFPLDSSNNPAPPYDECIAVSKGPDATGEYYVYDFHLSDQYLHDYPHFGLWPDGYYMSSHMFDYNNGLNYAGAGAFAFERAKLLAGQPAQMVFFRLGNGSTSFGGELPATLDGFNPPSAGAPNYFVEVDSAAETGTTAKLQIWKFHVDWTTPANSTFGINTNPNSAVSVADFVRPDCEVAGNRAYVVNCVPQAGDASQLDSIGDRLMYRLAYRNFGDHESVVLNHTVVANTTTGQMGPRWYELRDPGGSPTVFQQSTFGPTGQTDLLYRWMGSIAMDGSGDMAIGYSTSSLVDFPSIAYAGRLSTDAVNTLAQGEAQMFAGTGPQSAESFAPQTGRWGDYSALTIDPLDDCTFWYTTEYFAAGDPPGLGAWHTRVGNFKFSQCTPRQVGILRGTVTDSAGNPIAQVNVTAGGYTAITNDIGVYQFSPLAPSAYTVTASETGYFPSSASNAAVTNGGVTVQDFVLARNTAEATPTPPPSRAPIPNINPPSLSDPGTTITTNNYTLSWTASEVATGRTGYVIEESTDYVNPFFDNADGTTPPGQSGSTWTAGEQTDPWIQSAAYATSLPFSYATSGEDGGFTFGIDTSLTSVSNISIPANIGSARLAYYSRYFNDPDDSGNVEVSTDGGTQWTSLQILKDAPTVPPANTRMQSQEVNLTPYRGTAFKLRFRYNTGSFIYFLIRSLGWWVDDINIDGATWSQIATTDANTTSLNITTKPNGHYYYRVRATYSGNRFTTNSNVQDIIVNAPAPPQLVSVVSRKNPGAGDFDIPLPLTGTRGIECRSGDINLIFTFAAAVSNCGTATQGSASAGPGNNQCTVTLSALANQQYYQVGLDGVTNSGGGSANIPGPQWGLLIGDIDASGRVDGNDVSAVQSHTRQATDGTNLRFDVDASGRIDGNDVSATQGQTRTGLP